MAAEWRRSSVLGGEAGRGRVVANAVVLGFAVAGLVAFSAAGEAPFEQKARVQQLENAVLAPCCYTEPVSRHQSEIAVKMRIEIAKWVAEGRTDQEILDTHVRQYGRKVLVDPRTIPGWWTPWVPWLIVILGVVFGFWLLRRWHARPVAAALPLPTTGTVELPDFDDEE